MKLAPGISASVSQETIAAIDEPMRSVFPVSLRCIDVPVSRNANLMLDKPPSIVSTVCFAWLTHNHKMLLESECCVVSFVALPTLLSKVLGVSLYSSICQN